jgi:hypothetical protein
MKYSPRTIIFTAASKYLSPEATEKIKHELIKENVKQDRKFLAVVKRHFDFNVMKDKPFIPQDIWIYNYLLYETESKFKKNGLIAKYEREITIPSGYVYKQFI